MDGKKGILSLYVLKCGGVREREIMINYIEMHYYLNDESHSMNAFVFNKCEHELLGILNEIASKLDCYPLIEVEPIANGGLRSWLKLDSSQLTVKNAILIAFIPLFFANIVSAPIQEIESAVIKSMIENLLEDPEIKKLKTEKEKLQLQSDIQELEEKLNSKKNFIDMGLIKKKRSNFYSAILGDPKIESLSISSENIQRDASLVYNVNRRDFSKFLLSSNDLDPLIDEHASIEIISPVLKRGKYKWSGIYNDDIIHFSMNSREFKSLIESGAISFKNGSLIDCRLISRRKIDDEGCTQITKYEVDMVNSFMDNGSPKETPEGRNNRLNKKAKKDQLNLFENME